MTRITKITALAVSSVALAASIAQASSTAPLTAEQTARLGAQTEATGYSGLSRYAEARSTDQLAQAGAQTEATGYTRIAQYLQQRDASQADLAGQTEAAGYTGISAYLVAHAADQAAEAAAQTEATGYKAINSYLLQRDSTPTVAAGSSASFQWTDAGIGSAVTLGVALLAVAAALAIRSRRPQNPGLRV
jgi:hypothetical protein